MAVTTTTSTATPQLQTYDPRRLGGLTNLLGDILKPIEQPNKYLASRVQGDPTAIEERLKQYNVYDPSQLGGLTEYFMGKGAVPGNRQLYMKPEEFTKAQEALTGYSKEQLEGLLPMMGGLSPVGTLGGLSYYTKPELEAQLNKYVAADLTPYQEFEAVRGLKPVTTLSGQSFYDKSALESLQNTLSNYVAADLTPYQGLSTLANIKPIATAGGQTYYDKSTLEAIQKAKNYWNYIDPTVMKLLGSSAGQEDGRYYTTGLVDPTKFQVGLGSYGKQNIGGGKYNILGSTGEVLGTGYYDPRTAANQMFQANTQKAIDALSPTTVYLKYESIPDSFYYTPRWDRYEGGRQLKPVYVNNYNPENYLTDLANIPKHPYTQQFIDDVTSLGFKFKEGSIFGPTKGYKVGDQEYLTRDEAANALRSTTGQWYGGQGFGAGLSDWEVLGQALAGARAPAGLQEWGSLPLNSQSERITGENTLYGSTPIFYNGKLVGYKSDLAGAPGWQGSNSWSGGQGNAQWNPFGYQARYGGKSHSWATGIGRQLDPAAYSGLVQGLDGTEYFAPLSNVSKLPGWTNVENYQHQDQNYGGWGAGLLKLADALGPLAEIGGDLSLKGTAQNLEDRGLLYALHKQIAGLDPLGEALGDKLTNALGMRGTYDLASSVVEPVGNTVGALFAYGVPIGSLLMSLDAASQGNEKGAGQALGRGAMAYAGSQLAGANITGNAIADAALVNAATSAGNAAISGGDLNAIMKAGLMGGISGGLGNYLSGIKASPLTRIAASTGMGGLSAALRGQNIGTGALSGLASGAVGAGLGALGGAANRAGYGNIYQLGAGIANPIIRQMLAKQLYK